MSTKSFAGLLGLALLGAFTVPRSFGQGLGNSPYSRLGLGDTPATSGGIRQQSMGGVGLAAPNGQHINDLNPALVYYTSRTTFEIGVTGQYKEISNRLASQKDGSVNLGYISMALPISKRWALSLGLRPYSSVDYSNQLTEAVPGEDELRSIKQYEGKGGLTQVYLAQGVQVAKGLTLGLTSAYTFGSIDHEAKSTLYTEEGGVENATTTVINDHLYYSDFTFRLGAHYRVPLNEKLNLNAGGTYAFSSKLDGTHDQTLLREDIEGRAIESNAVLSGQKGYATLPATAQFGLSLDNNKTWSVSLDAGHSKWSEFTNFSTFNATPLHNTFRVASGGEITPDPASVDSYFKRITYRLGVSVEQMPYRPAGQVLYDRALSWGFTLPVPTSSPLESAGVNLGFTVGIRGNKDANSELPQGGVIQERYVRAQLGFSLNNRWFIKRRLE
ncbi:hypothetical protein HER32_10195 [Hymenobacter sp. BT18]|uniref:hypothetical protein n=1 Tax=Hymenobacter sp. BT18 TaxID=2835648 RepID=UPI00143E1A92|nr:hypothetical protein [Hymenobacter sp. BT18]QIX61524.1 hypothetical protein HER32_10195 [Hymenobacter sp. BT18]